MEPHPWSNKIIAIPHNAKAFDIHFVLNRAILLKWTPEQIMNVLKIMYMRMEHMVFLNGVSYLLFPVCKLPEAFSVMASKSWYFHYFNTEENLNNIGSIPDVLLWRE